MLRVSCFVMDFVTEGYHQNLLKSIRGTKGYCTCLLGCVPLTQRPAFDRFEMGMTCIAYILDIFVFFNLKLIVFVGGHPWLPCVFVYCTHKDLQKHVNLSLCSPDGTNKLCVWVGGERSATRMPRRGWGSDLGKPGGGGSVFWFFWGAPSRMSSSPRLSTAYISA